MKRMLIQNSIELNIEVRFSIDNVSLVATTVRPLELNSEIDPQAYADYTAFVDLLEAMIDYYDFEIVHSHPSKTSFYYMFAQKDEIAEDDVPCYVYLRVSDHVQQHKSTKHLKHIRDNMNIILDDNKKPKSKLRQRYQLLEIVVNNKKYETYEEAAQAAETLIRNWMIKRHIDLSKYEEMWTEN